MSDTKPDIRRRLEELQRQERNLRHTALRAISEQMLPVFDALHAECGQTGHQWTFHHFNWDGSYQWDVCDWCGATEGADQHAACGTKA